jgi:hypothetical protein
LYNFREEGENYVDVEESHECMCCFAKKPNEEAGSGLIKYIFNQKLGHVHL